MPPMCDRVLKNCLFPTLLVYFVVSSALGFVKVFALLFKGLLKCLS